MKEFSVGRRFKQKFRLFQAGTLLLSGALFVLICVTGCQTLTQLQGTAGEPNIAITVERGGKAQSGACPAGSTVSQALRTIQAVYNPEDIIRPALGTILMEDATIRITVVTFEEETSEKIIPFTSQTVRNETLPEGETYIIQSGQNGLENITTRSTFEDGVLVSQLQSKKDVVKDAVPEILMYGVKAEHAPVQIAGKIIYISNGSAWMLENTTGNRTPILTSGDLDGRILDLSSNGEWLLFTRKVQNDEINSLWMLHISDWTAQPISLRIANVVHFAAWLPGETLRVLYSTVTPQETAPGWKANNDLNLQVVSDTGMIMSKEAILEPEEAGVYSWWGTEFHLSQDGRILFYADATGIGEVDRLTGEKTERIKIQPYKRARSDWAWIPGMSRSADDATLFFAYHGDISGASKTYDPANFNIGRYNRETSAAVPLASGTGLFSQPTVSPVMSDGNTYVAYLQSINPQQSESSRYRIMLMDQNGENGRIVFPLEENEYIAPQKIVWSPSTNIRETWIAFIYQSNIWLVNPFTGIYNQITIDQSVTDMIWE